ncbi:MAG: hypothetical protein HYY06_23945 [Deltaproteobacteria bacterium]|nr:hypothetical protein [Deltaproteobacteria bacterium]
MSARLVVTVGPASRGMTGALVRAGATELRLNASHLSAGDLARCVEEIRAEDPTTPIVVDLQGAKIRLGAFRDRPVRAEDRVRLVAGEASGDDVPLPHPELFASARPGETILVDDGRLSLRVIESGSDCLVAESLSDGTLSSRKGVAVAEHPVVLADLTDADTDRIAAVANVGGVDFAVSFMATGEEASWVRRLAPRRRVIGKIERQAAVENVARIAQETDEVWICRGDLGAQLGPAGMARFVASFDPRRLPRPVLMAGQVLEHLVAHPAPTRSEVCHLFDLLERGYAGIVLSDETAVGHDPIAATRTAAAILASMAA